MDMDFKIIDDLDIKRNDKGFETVWSIWDNKIVNLDDKVVNEDQDMYKVTYRAWDDRRDQEVEFSALSATNTVAGFWAAAECVFQQAKMSVGDWHVFIEGFKPVEDGSFRMIAGS